MKAAMRVLLIIVYFFLGACSSMKANLPAALGAGGERPILFIADPQLHNMYGVGLRQMLPLADLIIPVAIRPAELNLLAPYALRELITQARVAAGATEPLMVVLGDVTNIGCSGELNDFVQVMNDGWAKKLWLAAHGNHDTYLMGTANTYGPLLEKLPSYVPDKMPFSALPTDEAWWGPRVTPQGLRNWRDGCYRSQEAGESTPMNKVRWLARYFDALKPYGLELTNTRSTERVNSLDVSAGSGVLKKLQYEMRGEWTKPDFERLDLTPAWESFVVQAVDLRKEGRHRLIIIDTSVCRKAGGGRFGWRFLTHNAGWNACIGFKQLDAIDELVDQAKDRLVIFAGHFPLKRLRQSDQDRLIAIMGRTNSGKWTYISAHTHKRASAASWGDGMEINIGSSTDWPMEAHLMYPAPAGGAIAQMRTFYVSKAPALTYVSARRGTGSELCRHLAAAEKLATMDIRKVGKTWVSPSVSKNCEPQTSNQWKERGHKLTSYIALIRARSTDKEYLAVLLQIAAAASRHEKESFVFGLF